MRKFEQQQQRREKHGRGLRRNERSAQLSSSILSYLSSSSPATATAIAASATTAAAPSSLLSILSSLTSSSSHPPNRRHPPGSRIIVPVESTKMSIGDHVLVALSSFAVVGSFLWVPYLFYWAWKRYRRIPASDKRKRAIYSLIILSITTFFMVGPHRRPGFGEKWLNVRKWNLWKIWFRFIAFEVVSAAPPDVANSSLPSSRSLSPTSPPSSPLSKQQQKSSSCSSTSCAPTSSTFDAQKDQAILAVIPHAIFPFALAFAALPEPAQKAFGIFRPIVATASGAVPVVRDFLSWLDAVDASRPAVDQALQNGSRIGVSPGGIAEMFEGYPKPLTHPDDEYAIVRKGILKLAIKHNIPIVPVYCFGSTKLLRRLQLPTIVETLSLLFRVSVVLFYGVWGLPIPHRQRLLYIMGAPIFPPPLPSTSSPPSDNAALFERQVTEMESKFCQELIRIFNQHKESYGWAHKKLIPILK